MPTEVLASTWPMLAAIDVSVRGFVYAAVMTSSTPPNAGGNLRSPAAFDPSWSDQLSAYAAALSNAAAWVTLGIAVLRPLRTRPVEQARSKSEKTLLTPALRTGLQQLRATAPLRPTLVSAARTAAASSPAGNTRGEAR